MSCYLWLTDHTQNARCWGHRENKTGSRNLYFISFHLRKGERRLYYLLLCNKSLQNIVASNYKHLMYGPLFPWVRRLEATLAGCFGLVVFCVIGVWCWLRPAHQKAYLRLENLIWRWLFHVAVDRRLGSLPCGPIHRWLECPYNMAGSFPQNEWCEREKKVSMPHTIYSHTVNSPYCIC